MRRQTLAALGFLGSLFFPASARVDSLIQYVNGVPADTMTQGDTATWSFKSAETQVMVGFYYDVNTNGAVDSVDPVLGEFPLSDNLPVVGPPPDIDTAVGRYGMILVLSLGTAPLLLRVGDSDTTLMVKMITLPLSSPPATISGKVTGPGASGASGIIVSARSDSNPLVHYSALTDNAGKYTLNLTAGFGTLNPLKVEVHSQQNLLGLVAVPTDTLVTAAAGANPGIDFALTLPPAFVEGTVKDTAGNGIKGIFVQAESRGTGMDTRSPTSSSGFYRLGADTGRYEISIDGGSAASAGYMQPKEKEITLSQGDTARVNFVAYPANGTLHGRVTRLGSPDTGRYLFIAGNDAYGDAFVFSDGSGSFKLGVYNGPAFNVCLIEDFGGDSVPAGFAVEGAARLFGFSCFSGVKAGDTARFNFIPAPAGLISGILLNGDSLPPGSRTRIMGFYGGGGNLPAFAVEDKGGNSFTVAGLRDSTYGLVACVDTTPEAGEEVFDLDCDLSGIYLDPQDSAKAGLVTLAGGDTVTGIVIKIGSFPTLSVAASLPAPALRNDLAVGPNPFSPSTRILVTLAGAAGSTGAAVRLFDSRGRLVRELFRGILEPGAHAFQWNGRDLKGRPLPAGVYFVKIRTDRFQKTRKVVLYR